MEFAVGFVVLWILGIVLPHWLFVVVLLVGIYMEIRRRQKRKELENLGIDMDEVDTQMKEIRKEMRKEFFDILRR